MAHIKEPKGVDFIVESSPLTEVEKKAISKFISSQKIKEKRHNKPVKKKKTPTT